MEERLVGFNTAKLAKEKGFNINTQYYYGNSESQYYSDIALYNEILERDGIEKCKSRFNLNYPLWCAGLLNDGVIYGYDRGNSERLMFPTQSLLQKWLREVHKINVESNYLPNIEKYGYLHIPMTGKAKRSDIKFVGKKYYDTYEESLEIGLFESLKQILEMDVDLRIVGFNYGTKGTKNENVISSLNCESSDGLVKTRPQGLKEDMMAYITENQDNLLGTVIQCKCNGLSNDVDGNYSLLYPSFVSFRDDKDTCDSLESIKEIENMIKTLLVE